MNHADRRVWIRPAHLNTSLTPGALKWPHCKSLSLSPALSLSLSLSRSLALSLSRSLALSLSRSLSLFLSVYARNVVKGKGLLNSHDLLNLHSVWTQPPLSALSLSLWWLSSPEAQWKMWCIFPGFKTRGSLLAASQFRNAQLTRLFYHTSFYHPRVFFDHLSFAFFFFCACKKKIQRSYALRCSHLTKIVDKKCSLSIV